jgi:hypothetical protein
MILKKPGPLLLKTDRRPLLPQRVHDCARGRMREVAAMLKAIHAEEDRRKALAKARILVEKLEPCPMQNGFVESFNDTFRYECLNAHYFLGLEGARRRVEAWRREYNERRPHQSIGRIPSAVFEQRAATVQSPPAPSGPLRNGSSPAAEAAGFVNPSSDGYKGQVNTTVDRGRAGARPCNPQSRVRGAG